MSVKTDFNVLAQKYGSPFYLIDKTEAIKRVKEIQNALPKNARLCYAIKANAFLIDFFKSEDILFEVCSPGELSICEKIGLNSGKIVFSGVVKTFEDIKRCNNINTEEITLLISISLEFFMCSSISTGISITRFFSILLST